MLFRGCGFVRFVVFRFGGRSLSASGVGVYPVGLPAPGVWVCPLRGWGLSASGCLVFV